MTRPRMSLWLQVPIIAVAIFVLGLIINAITSVDTPVSRVWVWQHKSGFDFKGAWTKDSAKTWWAEVKKETK